MKILHTESSLGWGGQEIRVLTEARGVAREGHEVLLAAPAEARIAAEAARFGVELRTVPIGRKGPAGIAAMRSLLQEKRFDVVNTHSSTDTWLTALSRTGLLDAPPIVRTRHISAPVPKNLPTRWLYTQATARIVTTGERLRRMVIDETGVAADKVVSVPTGIDLDRFRPGGDRAAAREQLGLDASSQWVGIIATLRSWKGHRYLLEAIAASVRNDIHVAIVGDGPQREALEKRAAELGIAERVRFAGNQEDVTPWLAAFDLFCLPSYANEGVPQALMQAMACGLAVVTTPVGSIREIVVDNDTGVIVPQENVPLLGAAIERLLADDDLRRTIGRAAATVARARFGEARMVEAMLAVFRQAAGHG